jgi:UDP-sulfoquinovose synthase
MGLLVSTVSSPPLFHFPVILTSFFKGWPLALSLSKRGDEVIIVDNMLRRDIDKELGVQSLTPICSIEKRITAWEELTGKKIRFHKLDISADFDSLLELIRAE